VTIHWAMAVPGRDDRTVHELIAASDRAAAARSGTRPPVRRLDSTTYLVETGAVHLARVNGVPIATVTAGPRPSFDTAETGLPEAQHPWYMQRLAVRPDCSDPLVGVQAVRRAIAAARAHGADAVRAEANPDLTDVLTLLALHGFVRYGTNASGPARRTFLQLVLLAASGTRDGS
jgi:hypothetical protein